MTMYKFQRLFSSEWYQSVSSVIWHYIVQQKLTYIYRIIRSGKLLLALAIMVILCANSRGTHYHILLSRDSGSYKTIRRHVPENKYYSWLRLRELQIQHRWEIQRFGADNVVACFNALSRHSIEETEKTRDKDVRIRGVLAETRIENFKIQGRNVAA
jgi:hypothetical protein